MRLRRQPEPDPESPLERLRARAEARRKGVGLVILEPVRDGWQARSWQHHCAYQEALADWRSGRGPEPEYGHYYSPLDDFDNDDDEQGDLDDEALAGR